MAKAVIPKRAKLFTGIISSDISLIEKAKSILQNKLGAIDSESPLIPFSHTEYYREMGEGLYKKFCSFEKLIDREDIVDVKLCTNELELELSPETGRIINIDPGYLTLSNVYLASCKEYYHRIYLTKGVHLENEYYYKDKRYNFFEWTYPDYKKDEYLQFFESLRKIYKRELEGCR